MNISPSHFEELIKKGHSLDTIYLLTLINEDYDVLSLCKESIKIDTLYKSLIRKGLIVDEKTISTLGKDLLAFIETPSVTKLERRKDTSTEFDDWWKAYPGTDQFTYKGKTFKGTRTLRQNKEECKLKFNKILLEGEYTAKQLIDALLYDVSQKKENSVANKTNKLTYMQNSLTYLNQRTFEPIIELLGADIKEEQVIDSTDI